LRSGRKREINFAEDMLKNEIEQTLNE